MDLAFGPSSRQQVTDISDMPGLTGCPGQFQGRDPHRSARTARGGADVIAIALGSTAVDGDVAAWAAEGDRRRREGQARIVAGWHAVRALRPDIGLSEARDVLYAMTSPELYLLMVEASGWSPGRYERWLDRTLRTLLLGAPSDPIANGGT